MRCPACGSTDLHVMQTRAHKGTVWRRRRCRRCGVRFSTREREEKSTTGSIPSRRAVAGNHNGG